jgi:4-amino-4-deoxy-L-arabinose transferase-like glycosyltransferase
MSDAHDPTWFERLRAVVLGHRVAVLCAVALGAALLRLPGTDGTLTDIDSWRQTDTATIARNFVDTPSILWPRIDWAAPGPGYVEAEFQLYPFAVSLIYRAVGENPLYGRLLSLALTALACLVFFRLARRFLTDGAAVLAVAILAATPIVFRYSNAFMPEPTVLLLYLLALDRFLTFLDSRAWPAALAAGACTGLAILVKPTSIHLGLVFLVLLVQRHGWRSLISGQAMAIAAIALLPAGAYYAHAARIHATYGSTFGVISGGDSKWGGFAWWTNPRFWLSLAAIDVGWMTGPIGALLCVYALLATRTRGLRTLALAWGATLILYYCIVARYAGDQGRGLHYHIYAAPLYALLTAGGIAMLWRRATATPRLIGLVLVAVLGYQAAIDGLILAKPKRTYLREAGLKLAELSRPTDTVVVLSEDVATEGAVANNFEQPDVFFHARRRGRVLAIDRQQGPMLAAVLDHDATWFVNFPRLNDDADPSFRDALAGMRRVFVGDSFEIYAVDTNRDSDTVSGPRTTPPG